MKVEEQNEMYFGITPHTFPAKGIQEVAKVSVEEPLKEATKKAFKETFKEKYQAPLIAQQKASQAYPFSEGTEEPYYMINDVLGEKGEKVSKQMKCREKIDFEINLSSLFEDQSVRLVKELGLSEAEAKIISKAIRDLTEVKIKEQNKKWPKSVCEAFANLITAILIEEVKAISLVPSSPKMKKRTSAEASDFAISSLESSKSMKQIAAMGSDISPW